METILIKKMADYDRNVRDEVAEVFVDGYFHELSYFTKNRNTLKSAFKSQFCPEVFYLAEVQGEIVGILACANNQQRAMPVAIAPLQNAFGLAAGELAYNVMSQEFNTSLPYDDETGYIECVATSERARGKGVSTSLMKYVMEKLPYRRYILEVAGTNRIALRLYQKLGFKEIERKSEDRIYMELKSISG